MWASLPMYARPELAQAHDQFWTLIRQQLINSGMQDVPKTLTQDKIGFDDWLDPQMLLSQTCGMPYRLKLHTKVTMIGTPDYALEGCAPGYYRSPFIVRAGDQREKLADFKGALFAYNGTTSQSGYAAPLNEAAKKGVNFNNRVQSGGHAASAAMVLEGKADIAALDGVTWRLIERFEPMAGDLRVLGWTEPTPGLPYISALGADANGLFHAVSEALEAMDAEHRDLLGIRQMVKINAGEYLKVPNP